MITRKECRPRLMTEYYVPQVNPTTEYRELANDFEHHFDAVREAIANAYDHKASEIRLFCDMIDVPGEERPVFRLAMEDDGSGMNRAMLNAFFDIGNSIKPKDHPAIGYKGHGTKVYFRSKRIDVLTTHDESGERWKAVLDRPWAKLRNGEKLQVAIDATKDGPLTHGTRITILGYFDNKGDLFTHEELKDYIRWFTAHGSARPLFDPALKPQARLWLKGADRKEPEEIPYGHPMPRDEVLKPKDVPSGEDPTDFKRLVYPPFVKEGITHPSGIPYKVEIVGVVAGKNAHYPRPVGVPARERLGLWLARDYILIDWRPDWVATDQTYLLFHFVVNCDKFSLTANRGSVRNTDAEILAAVENDVRVYMTDKVDSSTKYETYVEDREEAALKRKRSKAYKKLDARIKALEKRSRLGLRASLEFTPRNEEETILLLQSLISLESNSIPFVIADAEAQVGIDLVVRTYDAPKQELEYKVYEVEHKLRNFFGHEHSLSQVNGIVCWEDEGYGPGMEMDYQGQRVTYTATKPGAGLPMKALVFKAGPVPVYVLSDIVQFFRKNPGEACAWTTPFHCKKCNKEITGSIASFVEHVASH